MIHRRWHMTRGVFECKNGVNILVLAKLDIDQQSRILVNTCLSYTNQTTMTASTHTPTARPPLQLQCHEFSIPTNIVSLAGEFPSTHTSLKVIRNVLQKHIPSKLSLTYTGIPDRMTWCGCGCDQCPCTIIICSCPYMLSVQPGSNLLQWPLLDIHVHCQTLYSFASGSWIL